MTLPAALKLGAALGVAVSLTAATSGQDWESCGEALDRLEKLFRDAAEEAALVADADREEQHESQELEGRRDELEKCLRFPDVTGRLPDFRDGGCTSQRFNYERALSDYNYAVQRFEREASAFDSELLALRRQRGSVSSACEVEEPVTTGIALCELLRGYVSSLPIEVLMGVCTESLSESECRNCLGVT